MAHILTKIKKALATECLVARTAKSRKWLRQKIKELIVMQRDIMASKTKSKNYPIIGKMYFYVYDPKHKMTLPYYDKFPLVLPINFYDNGFLGLNLHYIHPKHRITLLDKLSDYLTNDTYDKKTKIRLSYALLQSVHRIYEHKPCIKRYLWSHVRSKFLEIYADEWDIAALLPMEDFAKATKHKVFADSRKKFFSEPAINNKTANDNKRDGRVY